MKLGLAFSGSGESAANAHCFVEELEAGGLPLGMLSASSLAALPAFLWARGFAAAQVEALMEDFFHARTPRGGLARLERAGALAGSCKLPVALCSVDVETGVAAIFCDSLRSDAWNLKVYPLAGNERAALGAALCPYGESPPQRWAQLRLCDFAARYGCPFFPLRMAGMEKLLAASFAGGGRPAQIAADTIAALTAKRADVFCQVEGPSAGEVRAQARALLPECYEKLL